MVLFQRKKSREGDPSDVVKQPSSTSVTKDPNGCAVSEEDALIKDNLDIMYDIIMQIREDEDFAKSIYADCPRLQYLLSRRPDLRPIFEDPKLVLINFEAVYRQEGGVLPEDEPKKPKRSSAILVAIVNSPCFKVLRVFLFLKKILAFIFGGGLILLKSIATGCCCDDGVDMDPDVQDMEPKTANDINKEALNRAADHMEDPQVQEQMNELLENDPEGLQEAIENDEELRALRDSNPLCAELMKEPETMRILTDPDNLRALGDAPELIEADFVDPDWEPPADIEAPHIESGVTDSAAVVEQPAAEPAENGATLGENFELGESNNDRSSGGQSRSGVSNESNSANASANSKTNRRNGDEQTGNNNGGNLLSQIGSGITNMVAAELVGFGFNELTGQDDPAAMLQNDSALDNAASSAEKAADEVDETVSKAAMVIDQINAAAEAAEDMIDEDLIDEVHDGVQDAQSSGTSSRSAKMAAIGVATAAGGVYAASRQAGKNNGAEPEEVEDMQKSSRFGFVGNWASALSSAGKEYIATSLLGDDIGSMLLDKLEADDDSDESDDEEQGSGSLQDENGSKVTVQDNCSPAHVGHGSISSIC